MFAVFFFLCTAIFLLAFSLPCFGVFLNFISWSYSTLELSLASVTSQLAFNASVKVVCTYVFIFGFVWFVFLCFFLFNVLAEAFHCDWIVSFSIVVVVGYSHSSYHRVMSLGSGSCAMSLVPRLCSSRRITAAIRAATPTSFSRYVKAASVLQTPARSFGNAPSRIRPVETPQEHAWRQGEREISASVIIVVMFIVPLWLFVLSAESQEKKRDAVRAWALEQRAAHRPSGGESDEKVWSFFLCVVILGNYVDALKGAVRHFFFFSLFKCSQLSLLPYMYGFFFLCVCACRFTDDICCALQYFRDNKALLAFCF